MLENDITDVLDHTFVDEVDKFGEMVEVELKPGGAKIQVTEDNKHEYVNLICKHRLLGRSMDQLVALKRGFNDAVPKKFMSMFDEYELELMICGLGEINVDDWAKNTEYVTHASRKVGCSIIDH